MENSYGFVEAHHVAQQRRRQKLRVAQNVDIHEGFKNNGILGSDHNQAMMMINFSSRDHLGNHDDDAEASSFSTCYDPQQQSCDWVVNCGSESMLSDHIGFQKGVGDAELLLQFPAPAPPPPPIYPNSLEEMTAVVQHNFTEINQEQEEGGSRNQGHLLGGYDTASWMDRGANFYNNCRGWGGDQLRKSSDEHDHQLRSFSFMSCDSNPQALSLSLSSNPSSKLPANTAQFVEDRPAEELLQGSVRKNNVKAESLMCRLPKPLSSNYGKSLQDHVAGVVVPVNSYRNTGPLGPFTGYATILKSSKFLKPAQLLLDEFCGSNGHNHKFVEPCTSDAALNELRNEAVVNSGNSSCQEASTFCGSNETNVSGVGSISSESHQPEYQQKKAKLVYMLEEVRNHT